MSCYRKGGCGPYEMYSCSECPASKPEYLEKDTEELISKYMSDRYTVWDPRGRIDYMLKSEGREIP